MLLASCAAVPVDVEVFPPGTITVGDQTLEVAIADDRAERARGLQGVEDLAGLDGMLFAYDTAAPATYYMLGTLIPLDIWWFDDQGRLAGSAGMEPCTVEPCTRYRSPGPVRWVLETPAGEFDFAPGTLLGVPTT